MRAELSDVMGTEGDTRSLNEQKVSRVGDACVEGCIYVVKNEKVTTTLFKQQF